MKKGISLMLAISVSSAILLSSCGEKFTPLTQEQITAKVDSSFNAQKDAKLQELRAACQSGLEAQVNAKVEMMKSGQTAGK
jgi:hypothetical protein